MTAYTADQLERARGYGHALIADVRDDLRYGLEDEALAKATNYFATALAAERERAIEEAAQYLEATTETKPYAAELRRALARPGGEHDQG